MRILMSAVLAGSMALASADRCFTTIYNTKDGCKTQSDDFVLRASFDPEATGDKNCAEVKYEKGKLFSDSNADMTALYKELTEGEKFVAVSGVKSVTVSGFTRERLFVEFFDKDSQKTCKDNKADSGIETPNEKYTDIMVNPDIEDFHPSTSCNGHPEDAD